MSVASSGERRPCFDEAGALRVALECAARELVALSARSDSRAAERLEFQLGRIEDEALLASVWDDTASGAPADSAWRRAAEDLCERVLSHLRAQTHAPIDGDEGVLLLDPDEAEKRAQAAAAVPQPPITSQVVADLLTEGVAARLPKIGMMVEAPAAALTICDFAADFFSIGSNDFSQFVLACDRGNGEAASRFDPMRRAMVELMRRVVDHGRSSGRSVTICGDVAADPRQAIAVLNCGLRDFSMSPNSLVAVRDAILGSREAVLD